MAATKKRKRADGFFDRPEEELVFARHLRRLLSATGAPSQVQAAAGAQMRHDVLGRYADGESVPRVHVARRIADALGATLDEMTAPIATPARERRLGRPVVDPLAPAAHSPRAKAPAAPRRRASD